MSVRTDFRIMLRFEKILDDPQLTDMEKISTALSAFYVEPVQNQMEAWDGLLNFYRIETEQKSGTGTKEPRVLDYDQDKERLYCAFATAYGIRLALAPMHWYEFRTLLMGLPSESDLAKIMGYRSADLSTIEDKSERKRIAALQKFYKIKDLSIPKTREDKEKAYLSYLDKRYEEMHAAMRK